MINVYKLGQYTPGGSCVHKMHPLSKIIVVIALSIIIFRAGAFVLAAVGGFLAAIMLLSRLTVKYVLKAIRPALPFFALLFLVHLFCTGGTPIPPFPLWHVSITYEGLRQGALLVWRFVLLVLSASLLTMVTSPSELIIGMERLLKPLRFLGISSSDLAVMLSLALRFMPALLEEIDRIREARLARGADFNKGSLLKRTKAITSLAIPLTLNTFRRAEELAAAMEARGYRRGPRTYLKELTMAPLDYIVIGAAVIAGVASFIFS